VAPVALVVYVEDVDDVFDRAIEAGAGRSVERPDDLFAEDDWKHGRIADVELRFAERCGRCFVTTIDPQTGVAGGNRGHARDTGAVSHKTWFGIRTIPSTTGVIRVGESVAPA
jgi:MOSC domain-containing protein